MQESKSQEYYLISTSHKALYPKGALLFELLGGKGYTSSVDQAGRFSEEEARKIHSPQHGVFAIPCEAVDEESIRIVDRKEKMRKLCELSKHVFLPKKLLTNEQLQTLQHALGADEYGRREQYNGRNYYVGETTECEELVALGFMQKFNGNVATGGEPLYRVTDPGIRVMREESPNPPKLTRGKKRYQDYLKFSDAYDCTFKEYLQIIKTDWYKEMQANA